MEGEKPGEVVRMGVLGGDSVCVEELSDESSRDPEEKSMEFPGEEERDCP